MTDSDDISLSATTQRCFLFIINMTNHEKNIIWTRFLSDALPLTCPFASNHYMFFQMLFADIFIHGTDDDKRSLCMTSQYDNSTMVFLLTWQITKKILFERVFFRRADVSFR